MEWSPTRREFLGVAGLGSAVPASGADDSAADLADGTLGNATDAVPDHPFAPTATRRWSADASDGPVLVEATGDVLVAASHDAAVGLSLDGTERWRFGVELPDRDHYPDVLARGETVYVGDGETVRLLDAADGSVRWEFRDEKYTSVRTATDELALLDDDDGLVALSPTDGSERWRFAPERGHVWADRVADGDAIYFGTTEGQFYAVDAADGAVRWRTDFPGEADAGYDTDYPHLVPASATDDRVLVWESEAGRLYGLDRDSGRRRWTVETDSEVYGFPGTVRDGVAYLNDAPHLRAISTADGRESWRYDFGRELGWKPTVLDDGIYVGGSGEAAAVERDGTERWRFATGDGSHASVVDSLGDALVVSSHTTAVYAVLPEDGRLLWRFDNPKSLTWLPRVVGDSVVVGTDSGTLFG
jgi:outer membrane protein assembly factor BamB